MTLKKLAEITGTTVGTVSKAFSEKPEISEETKKKIFDTYTGGGGAHVI